MTEIDADELALLRDSQRRVDGQPPDFDQVFRKAQATAVASKPRWPRFVAAASIAAAAGWLALSIVIQPPAPVFILDDDLMGSTRWVAPSDSLLPRREFDIYEEIPRLFESTVSDAGALL